MSDEKELSGHESLQIITEMIQKVKANIHERGTSAILWGSVTAIAGLVSFAQLYFNFSIGFDIWVLVMVAIIPQVFISIRENKTRKYRSLEERAIDAIWIVYGISIFCYVFYLNVVPIYSAGSIFLILYAIPTLATGIITKFKPMLIGGIISYIFFIISCYTSVTWDMLLMGLAGIFNWLIPGFILRQRYLKGIPC